MRWAGASPADQAGVWRRLSRASAQPACAAPPCCPAGLAALPSSHQHAVGARVYRASRRTSQALRASGGDSNALVAQKCALPSQLPCMLTHRRAAQRLTSRQPRRRGGLGQLGHVCCPKFQLSCNEIDGGHSGSDVECQHQSSLTLRCSATKSAAVAIKSTATHASSCTSLCSSEHAPQICPRT